MCLHRVYREELGFHESIQNVEVIRSKYEVSGPFIGVAEDWNWWRFKSFVVSSSEAGVIFRIVSNDEISFTCKVMQSKEIKAIKLLETSRDVTLKTWTYTVNT